MIRAGTAYSKLRPSEEAVERTAMRAMERAGIRKADAVIFFASSRYRQSYDSIPSILKKVTGTPNIVGASGYGILTEEAEIERPSGLGIMVIASDSVEMTSFLVSNLQESNFRAGEEVAQALSAANPDLMLLFPDSYSFQSHLFFDGFENTAGYVPMIGGAAAEDVSEEKTYQIAGERVAYDAVAGLGFSGRLRLEVGITRSCQPFGEPLQITRAEGNMIYEIDGRPAYDILLESLSHLEFENPNQIFQNVFLGVPLKNFQTEFVGEQYLIRNIMGVNAKKGMLACVCPIEEGEFVTFTLRDAKKAKEDMDQMLSDLRERIAPARPAMGFYFNSCGRGQNLYGKPHQDISLIRSYFPEVPILGFFTYGEIAPVDFVNHLHHHSGILALLVEE